METVFHVVEEKHPEIGEGMGKEGGMEPKEASASNTIDHSKPVSRSVTLSILSYNTYLIPAWFVSDNFHTCVNHNARAHRIGKLAANYDIVCLQEMWGENLVEVMDELDDTHEVAPECRSSSQWYLWRSAQKWVDLYRTFIREGLGGLYSAHHRRSAEVLLRRRHTFSVGREEVLKKGVQAVLLATHSRGREGDAGLSSSDQKCGVSEVLRTLRCMSPNVDDEESSSAGPPYLLVVQTHLDAADPLDYNAYRAHQFKEIYHFVAGVVVEAAREVLGEKTSDSPRSKDVEDMIADAVVDAPAKLVKLEEAVVRAPHEVEAEVERMRTLGKNPFGHLSPEEAEVIYHFEAPPASLAATEDDVTASADPFGDSEEVYQLVSTFAAQCAVVICGDMNTGARGSMYQLMRTVLATGTSGEQYAADGVRDLYAEARKLSPPKVVAERTAEEIVAKLNNFGGKYGSTSQPTPQPDEPGKAAGVTGSLEEESTGEWGSQQHWTYHPDNKMVTYKQDCSRMDYFFGVDRLDFPHLSKSLHFLPVELLECEKIVPDEDDSDHYPLRLLLRLNL